MVRLDFGGGGLPDEDGPPLTDFIKSTDQVEAVARPGEIGEFYIEHEYGHAEDEQRQEYARKASVEARVADEQAAGSEHEAEQAKAISIVLNETAVATNARHDRARAVMGPYVRRPGDAKWMKYLRMLLILGGDIAGIAGAALLLGEQPINAFLQATSAAASAVTLGAVGREWRYVLAARQRQKDPQDLTDEEQPFSSFFAGPHSGESLVKSITLLCLGGVFVIATGIFALRGTAEGTLAGIAFSCFALALGLASMVNAWDTADDVAEMLDAEAAAAKKASVRAERARAAPAIARHAAAKAQSESIRAANGAAGEAAAAGVRRRLYAALGNSPGVAGHGTAAGTVPGGAESNGSGDGRKVKLRSVRQARR